MLKKHHLFIIVNLLIGMFLLYHIGFRPIPSAEVHAIKDIYDHMGGEHWPEKHKKGWFENGEISCNAYGIVCDDFKHITRLDLSGLKGKIPTSIKHLVYLEFLSLSGNFASDIPAEIGSLVNLEYLSIGSNMLEGGLPKEIGRLPKLRHLDVYGETSEYNSEERGLISITHSEGEKSRAIIRVKDKNRTGIIPPEIGNLKNLQLFSIAGYNFRGVIPEEIGQLVQLSSLSIGFSAIEGEIPHSIGQLRNLTSLHIYGVNISGPIPDEIGNLE
ncbi:Leucine-rich repeat containing protein, partial [hydrothermal vent metagenome]